MSGYSVDIERRLFDILGVWPIDLGPEDTFTYTWDRGHETLTARTGETGGLDYRGVYHPAGHCEGEGICRHCGRTLDAS